MPPMRRVPPIPALLLGLILSAGSVLLANEARAAEPQFPALTGRVVDDAGILSEQDRQELTAALAAFEKQTGDQIVVATLTSLQGLPIADYGYQLGRHWGIGRQGKDNGAVLIVAPKEKKVRIEVGYGLEGDLTDAKSRIIIENDILPRFRQGDFAAGIKAGVAAMIRTLGGTYNPALPPVRTRQQRQPWPFPLLLALPVILIILFNRFSDQRDQRGRRYRRGYRSPMILPGGFGGYGRRGGGFGGFGGPAGGGFGGGSGGGGFSGGGGSFGGGGASGSW
jgi:uncharacterized protein